MMFIGCGAYTPFFTLNFPPKKETPVNTKAYEGICGERGIRKIVPVCTTFKGKPP